MKRRYSTMAAIAVAAALACGITGCAAEPRAERAALQEPATTPINCGLERCDRGEACCRATGECYEATCIGCCPTDLPLPSPVISMGIDAGLLRIVPRPPLPAPAPWDASAPMPPR